MVEPERSLREVLQTGNKKIAKVTKRLQNRLTFYQIRGIIGSAINGTEGSSR
jgi:hypothetical protein